MKHKRFFYGIVLVFATKRAFRKCLNLNLVVFKLIKLGDSSFLLPLVNLLFCQLNLLQSFKKFLFFFQFRKLLVFRKYLERIHITIDQQNGSITWTKAVLIFALPIFVSMQGEFKLQGLQKAVGQWLTWPPSSLEYSSCFRYRGGVRGLFWNK